MTEKHTKSFFLVPTWKTSINITVDIGNIIQNPLDPKSSLTQDFVPTSDKKTITQNDKYFTVTETKDLKPTLIGRFLKSLNSNVEAHRQVSSTKAFDIKSVTTTTYEPTLAYLKERCYDDDVKNYINISQNPVYMITRLKKANDVKFSEVVEETQDLSGKRGNGGRWKTGNFSVESVTDPVKNSAVLAYSLIKIQVRGNELEFEDYTEGAHFVDEDD